MNSYSTDSTRSPRGRADTIGVDPRYRSFAVEPDETIIYDAENEAAWIQSDLARTLVDAR